MADSTKTQTAPRRKNMRSAEREKLIVTEAVRFFAECGFEGKTRELAKRMGVSHAVIYKHFESKEALIERVYEHVYLKRWDPNWDSLVLDRSLSLQERLTQFYIAYADRVFEYDWVRIFVSSGLKSYGLTERYLGIIRTKIIRPAAMEFRHDCGRSDDLSPLTEEELEVFWGLHGAVFYIAIRKYVYGEALEIDIKQVVSKTVSNFFTGLKQQTVQT